MTVIRLTLCGQLNPPLRDTFLPTSPQSNLLNVGCIFLKCQSMFPAVEDDDHVISHIGFPNQKLFVNLSRKFVI